MYGIYAYIDPRSTTPMYVIEYASPMECLGTVCTTAAGRPVSNDLEGSRALMRCHIHMRLCQRPCGVPRRVPGEPGLRTRIERVNRIMSMIHTRWN